MEMGGGNPKEQRVFGGVPPPLQESLNVSVKNLNILERHKNVLLGEKNK